MSGPLQSRTAGDLAPAVTGGFHNLAVLLDPTTISNSGRFDLALDTATEHQAGLTGLFLSIEPEAPFAREDVVQLDAVREMGRRREAVARDAEAAFRAAAEAAGVIADWMVCRGDYCDVLRQVISRTRTADLVFAGQIGPGGLDLPDHLVIDAGRPVVLVPGHRRFPRVGRRVLIAWNSSREASRALNDAMPILRHAEEVIVLTVEPGDIDARFAPRRDMQIGAALARHGIRAQIRRSFVGSGEIGEAILHRANETGADLLVMGAYGHTRQRAPVFGGVTRHLMAHMPIPVLMSH